MQRGSVSCAVDGPVKISPQLLRHRLSREKPGYLPNRCKTGRGVLPRGLCSHLRYVPLHVCVRKFSVCTNKSRVKNARPKTYLPNSAPTFAICVSKFHKWSTRIVEHGNVYLSSSHPDHQICSSGPEKSPPPQRGKKRKEKFGPFCFAPKRNETWEHRDNGQDSVFHVCA